MAKFLWWLTNRLRVRVIHVDGQPYLERYLLLKAFGLTAYLHHFVRGDSERWLHDHPWPWAFAVVLTGGYHEERWRYLCPVAGLVVHEVPVRWWNLIRARDFHRIVRVEVGTWTLFIHPRRAKSWGFVRALPVMMPCAGAVMSYEQPFPVEQQGDFFESGKAMTGRELRRSRELERAAAMLRSFEPTRYCNCWFCLNTGPKGECENCGLPPSPQRLGRVGSRPPMPPMPPKRIVREDGAPA